MARSFSTPEVQPRPDSTPYVKDKFSPDEFGWTGAARTVLRVGEAVKSQIDTERQKADAFAAAELDMQYAKEVSSLLYDPKAGYMLRQGRDAVDNKDVLDGLDKLFKKYEGLAQNDQQRHAFVTKARARAETWHNSVNQHAGIERRKWYESVAAGTGKLVVDEISRNFDKPDEVEKQLGLAKPILMLQWLETMSPEEAQARWRLFEAESLGHAVEGYIGAERPTEGRAYYEKVKDRLGVRAAGLGERLKVAKDTVEIERLSTEAFARVESESTDSVTRRFNPELARAALVELYPPEVRAKIEQKVKADIAEAERQQNIEDANKISRLSIEMIRTGGLNRNSGDYVTLDDPGRAKLEHDLEVRTRIRESGAKAAQHQRMINKMGLDRFRTIVNPVEQAALTDKQLVELQPGMDEAGLVALQAKRAEAQKIAQKGQSVTRDAFNGRVAKYRAIIAKKWGDSAAMKFNEIADVWYHGLPEGKDPTEQEVSKFLGSNLLLLDYTWPQGNAPAFMGNEKERAPVEQGGIPRMSVEDQEFEEAKALLRGEEAAKNDPYAEQRKRLKPGKVLILRDGQVGQVSESGVLPTDKRL